MTPDVEREEIRKAVHSIGETTGERPVGWYSRYAPSPNTRALLVEEAGFLYHDSDSYADEIPYWVRVDGRACCPSGSTPGGWAVPATPRACIASWNTPRGTPVYGSQAGMRSPAGGVNTIRLRDRRNSHGRRV